MRKYREGSLASWALEPSSRILIKELSELPFTESTVTFRGQSIKLEKFSNSPDAMKAYQEIHREDPTRELYVLHTSRKEPNIIEKKWVGVRR
ncbi:hypothetical protein [Calidifontibacillus oryziterrae]|uniref:hypothetical protein n=1 Tax=Calidifontibacillus oryziterrae TaxID=1191699 RepID=UPI00037A81CD|nr:hypothetical protein [Calidifontibacillus oryziterrae]